MSIKQKYSVGKNLTKHFDFILMDFVILELSYFLAVLWYHYSFAKVLSFGSLYRQQSLILFVCLIASFTVGQPYKNILKRDKWQEISSVVKHAISMAILDIVLMYIMKDTTSTSRLTFSATWLFYFVIETIFRLFWKRRIRSYLLKHSNSRRQLLVLTTRSRSEMISENLDIYLFRPFDVCGVFFTDFDKKIDGGTHLSHTDVMGGTEEMIDYAVHNWVDEVFVDIPGDYDLIHQMENVFSTMGIMIHSTVSIINTNETASSFNDSYVEKLGNYIVLTHAMREIPPIQLLMKRLLDIVGGVIGSAIAIIIIIIVGPIIKKKSPGPIIFAQERVGKNGKTFRMYKIRSMYMDAEARKTELMSQNKMDGFMFKIDDDPRIIGSEKKDKDGKPKGIGNFIRNTSLDEFPQFFNVIKGDMSLVGTRPPTVDEWEKYSPEHRKRLSIKPGITGLWQISGRSQITDFEKVVKLDSEYVDTWTIGMDIKIIFKTITKVLKREGAE